MNRFIEIGNAVVCRGQRIQWNTRTVAQGVRKRIFSSLACFWVLCLGTLRSSPMRSTLDDSTARAQLLRRQGQACDAANLVETVATPNRRFFGKKQCSWKRCTTLKKPVSNSAISVRNKVYSNHVSPCVRVPDRMASIRVLITL